MQLLDQVHRFEYRRRAAVDIVIRADQSHLAVVFLKPVTQDIFQLPEILIWHQRRLPVIDRKGTLVGMLSLGDVAAKGTTDSAAVVGASLGEISRPARPDRSSQSAPSGPAGGGAEGSAAR